MNVLESILFNPIIIMNRKLRMYNIKYVIKDYKTYVEVFIVCVLCFRVVVRGVCTKIFDKQKLTLKFQNLPFLLK